MVEVLRAGLYTSIQDSGRPGFRASGVPLSGPMDQLSAQFANMLLNNPYEAAVLEFVWPAPKLRFLQPSAIAVAGANFRCYVNGEPQASIIYLDHHDELTFSPPTVGVWGYLAVEGGWQTERVLDSRSQYRGITTTGKLHSSDMIPIPMAKASRIPRKTSVTLDTSHFERSHISCQEGPDGHLFGESKQPSWGSIPLSISPKSNRMAYILDGLEGISLPEIITAPVQPGTVQITPSGDCIVLMRDAQTTGGYARVLQLPEKSISQLAQKRAGEKVYLELG